MAAPSDISVIDVYLADGVHLSVVYEGNVGGREAVQDLVIATILGTTAGAGELCEMLDACIRESGMTLARSAAGGSEILTIH
jgi:hypothetical protein